MTVGEKITTVHVGDRIVNYDPTKDESGTEITGEKATVTSSQNDNGYSSGNRTYKISDFTGGWIVLGVDEKSGQLIITTDDVIKAGGSQTLGLQGAMGYAKGIGELDKISQLYGQGKYADKENTRSIKVEDINKVTGYKPTENPYNSGEINQYGSIVEYSWDNTDGKKVKYESKTVTGKSGTSDREIFQYPKDDGTIEGLKDNETKSFTSTGYFGLSISDESYKKLNNGVSGPYWLGPQYVCTFEGYVSFGIRDSGSSGNVNGNIFLVSSGTKQRHIQIRPPCGLSAV